MFLFRISSRQSESCFSLFKLKFYFVSLKSQTDQTDQPIKPPTTKDTEIQRKKIINQHKYAIAFHCTFSNDEIIALFL